MKIVEQTGHQGDVQFFKIEGELPQEFKKVNKRFIAASEQSGSVHALFGNYEIYQSENNDSEFIIDVKEESILNHTLETNIKSEGVSLDDYKVLPKKDHRHSVIKPGRYYVGIQQRFDPLEGYREKVKD